MTETHVERPRLQALPGEIRTMRLVLRRWRAVEAAELKGAIDANLEWLQRFMPWARNEPTPIEGMTQRLETYESNFDTGVEWLYAIRSKKGELLGGTGLHPRIGAAALEIGYWLRQDVAGQGFATEAAEALTRLALKHPEIERIEIRCDPRNAPSAAIPQRLGYRHVRTIENAAAPATGDLRDLMIWELRRRDYQET